MNKKCRRCNRTKPLRLFYKRKANKDGYMTICKSCKNKKKPVSRNSYLLSAYGITESEYLAQLAAQGGVCAICGGGTTKRNFDVDHNHKNGKVRGLLCRRCNSGLAKFMDKYENLIVAAAYLEIDGVWE